MNAQHALRQGRINQLTPSRRRANGLPVLLTLIGFGVLYLMLWVQAPAQ
jgi:hypothetical protein